MDFFHLCSWEYVGVCKFYVPTKEVEGDVVYEMTGIPFLNTIP